MELYMPGMFKILSWIPGTLERFNLAVTAGGGPRTLHCSPKLPNHDRGNSWAPLPGTAECDSQTKKNLYEVILKADMKYIQFIVL